MNNKPRNPFSHLKIPFEIPFDWPLHSMRFDVKHFTLYWIVTTRNLMRFYKYLYSTDKNSHFQQNMILIKSGYLNTKHLISAINISDFSIKLFKWLQSDKTQAERKQLQITSDKSIEWAVLAFQLQACSIRESKP